MYKITDEIFIISTKIGYIAQLRQSGPIRTPIKVPIAICLDMVTANIPVHEFDPVTKKVVELTVINLFDSDKFVEKNEVASTPVQPPIVNTDLHTADNSEEDVVDDIPSEEPVMMMTAAAAEVEVATADEAVVEDAPVVEDVVVAQATEEPVVPAAPAPAPVQQHTQNHKNNNNQKRR